MAEDRVALLTAREAAGYLRVSLFTLGKIEKQGGLVPFRTPGGHRRYSLAMLNEYLEGSRRRSAAKGASAQQNKPADDAVRILIIGSKSEALDFITRALRPEGDYEFASASDSYEAGVQAMAFKPDLIILDTAGLGFDEFEFCRKVKSDPQTKHIKVIGIVGFGKDEDVERIIECGADDCLIKPLQIEELQRSVRGLASGEGAVEARSSALSCWE